MTLSKRNYITLGEVYGALGFVFAPHSSTMTTSWFTNGLSTKYLKPYVYGLNSTRFTSSVINACVDELMTIVSNRHVNDYVGYIEEDTLTLQNTVPFLNKILNVIELTAPKYIPMLKESEIATENLLKGATSSSASDTRFNDTPQDGGDFNNDSHATNVSHTESSGEIEPESMIDHIKKVFDNFESVILMWSNEFNNLFFLEDQLDG